MSQRNIDDLKRNVENAKQGAIDFFSFKSRRERLSMKHSIVIDPGSFLIGAIGAAAVGGLAEESSERVDSSQNPELFVNSVLRILSYPIKTCTRFVVGGCIYVAVDNLVLHTLQRRAPFIPGVAVGICFANGSRPGVLLGSVVGMAIFAQLADMFLDSIINTS